MAASSTEREVGRAAVAYGARVIEALHPEWSIAKKRASWWQIGSGPAHMALSFQPRAVTNPALSGNSHQPAVRVSAEMVFDAPASGGGAFEEALAAASSVHESIGHGLTWLPNGNDGQGKRHSIRSSRAIDASTEDLGNWLVVELLLLERALAAFVTIRHRGR